VETGRACDVRSTRPNTGGSVRLAQSQGRPPGVSNTVAYGGRGPPRPPPAQRVHYAAAAPMLGALAPDLGGRPKAGGRGYPALAHAVPAGPTPQRSGLPADSPGRVTRQSRPCKTPAAIPPPHRSQRPPPTEHLHSFTASVGPSTPWDCLVEAVVTRPSHLCKTKKTSSPTPHSHPSKSRPQPRAEMGAQKGRSKLPTFR
jgi:hypothetical protein